MNILSKLSVSGIFMLLLLMAFISCNNDPEPSRSTRNITLMNDSLLDYNKETVRSEEQEIKDLIRRYSWKMTESPTGLRYMIYRRGNGEKAGKGMKATLRCEIRLMNGNLIYTYGEKSPKEIIPGKSESEQGLQEGILYMRVGDRAKFIVPSHLAFGLLGDQDRIPPKSALIYDVELIKLNNP